jgi:hypothetical protein
MALLAGDAGFVRLAGSFDIPRRVEMAFDAVACDELGFLCLRCAW